MNVRPSTLAESLAVLKARLSEHLSPAEKRELDEAILIASSTTEYTDRDRHQIKDAEHLIASSGEWMVQQIDANPSIHTPEFEMIHRLRHSLRDLYRIVSTGLSATTESSK